MSVRLRKVEYMVHMDKLDADGNIVDEMGTQQPLALYPHQLGELPAQVAAVVAQAEAHDAEAAPSNSVAPTPNRATRRATARKKSPAAK